MGRSIFCCRLPRIVTVPGVLDFSTKRIFWYKEEGSWGLKSALTRLSPIEWCRCPNLRRYSLHGEDLFRLLCGFWQYENPLPACWEYLVYFLRDPYSARAPNGSS
jgi:hypothetical protein